ncbi:MAG: hypothetical protein P1V20_01955 [Verrucomicrobiales bacterium]|nr:hypothetical protein [Verrucomicrobiales bacterium]
MSILLTVCLPGLFLFFSSITQSVGQVENPVQTAVQEITAPAPVKRVQGNLVPLIWKAVIDDAIVSVPFSKIEFFGIQDYVIDGATRVRELTISTEAQSMIRIYHIRPVRATKRIVNNIDNLRKIAEGQVPDIQKSDDEEKPVKVFPSTTHVHMVEYRVLNLADINKLYDNLEAAMIEYHARYLVPEQREGTIRKIDLGG